MGLIELVVFLVIIGLVFWVVGQLSSAFGIPAPITTVINVVLVIIVVLYLLQMVGVVGPVLRVRW